MHLKIDNSLNLYYPYPDNSIYKEKGNLTINNNSNIYENFTDERNLEKIKKNTSQIKRIEIDEFIKEVPFFSEKNLNYFRNKLCLNNFEPEEVFKEFFYELNFKISKAFFRLKMIVILFISFKIIK